MKINLLITILILMLFSCKKKVNNCIPEIKEYYFHNNSAVCNFQQNDSITDRFFRNKDLYDIPYQQIHSCFLIDGTNTVFEYNYHKRQCTSEPYLEYFLFQVPSFLDEFKVKDRDLKYLHCALDQTCQICGCHNWIYNKGLIYGKKINNSKWFVSVDIIAQCNDSLSKNDVKIKYDATYFIHKGHCENYVYKKNNESPKQ